MKNILMCTIFVAVIAIVVSTAAAQQPNHIWSSLFGGASASGSAAGLDVVIDSQGSLIHVGYFRERIDLGGGMLLSAGREDLYIAKFDAHGEYLWGHRFGDSGEDKSIRVAVDPFDNILITGHFEGVVDFGGGSLESARVDMYIAKFDADGNHLWSRSFGDAAGFTMPHSIVTNQYGSIVVNGSYWGDLDFGGGSLAPEFNGLFLVEFDTNGNHTWSTGYAVSTDYTTDMVIDSSDNLFVCGSFSDTIDFGGGPLTSAGVADGFLARLDANGGHVWSHRYGDADYNYIDRLALDDSGNPVLIGSYRGTMDFGGGQLPSAPLGKHAFIVKLDSNAGHVWQRAFWTRDQYPLRDVAIDANGRTVTTGSLTGNLGGGEITGAISIAMFNTDGSHFWSQGYGFSGHERLCIRVATDEIGNFVVTGINSGTLDFGGGPLISDVQYDAFAAMFGSAPVPTLLSSFSARFSARGVVVNWQLSDKAENTGWLIRRARNDHRMFRLHPVDVIDNDFNHKFVDETVEPGHVYRYQVFAATDGVENLLFETSPVTVPASEFGIGDAFPNPFNPTMTIRYTLGSEGPTTLRIYDVGGRLVRELVDGAKGQGNHAVKWDGKDSHGKPVTSGIYFVRLVSRNHVKTKKIVCVK